MNKQRMICGLCALWLLMGAGACGYRFTDGGVFPAGIESVFVPGFSNRTSETGIEVVFTNEVIYEITRRSRIRLVEKEAAEGILAGMVESLNVENIAHRGRHTAIERRVTIYIEVKLIDRGGKVVWMRRLGDSESYFVGQSRAATGQNQQAAIRAVAERLAQTVYDQLTVQF